MLKLVNLPAESYTVLVGLAIRAYIINCPSDPAVFPLGIPVSSILLAVMFIFTINRLLSENDPSAFHPAGVPFYAPFFMKTIFFVGAKRDPKMPLIVDFFKHHMRD